MRDLFEQRLRKAAGALPAPTAPSSLIDRVIAERETGRRIALPTDLPTSRRSPMRILALLLGAASIVVTVSVVAVRQQRRPSLLADADSVSSIEQLFVSAGVLPRSAFAQQSPSVPGAPPLTAINGLALQPVVRAYRLQRIDSSGHATPDGDGTIRLSDAVYDAAPAWRVEHVAHLIGDSGQPRIETETLYVTRRDLRPLARVVHVTPFRRFSQITIRQRFVGDSVLGEMTTDDGVRRRIARPLPRAFGPYVSDALAPLVLTKVPLSPQWRAGLSIVGWAVVPNDVFFPVTLEVIGDERLVTASGSFDCWKLRVIAGPERRIEWVRKSDGTALRAIDERPTTSGRREYLLLDP